jgi:phosphodiesterase/alkaline phosphatase D-like protein
VAAPDDPGFSGDPFRLGVASGDPLPDAVVLWTRLVVDPTADDAGLAALAGADLEVAYDVALDDAFAAPIRSARAGAAAADGHSVHVDVTGLPAGGRLFYRFRVGPWTSGTGRTRTAPDPAGTDALLLAAASCQHWEMGHYAAHRHLAAEGVDIVLFLGDFIYEGAAGAGAVRPHPAAEADDLAGYRLRYAWYRRDPDLQAAQASAPWVVVWDDHEVRNNYAGGAAAADGAAFAARLAAARQAWWENQPVRLARPSESGWELHRQLGWGRLVRLLLLDGRSDRDAQPCPPDAFGEACAEVAADRTMLGEAQERWLEDAFAAAAADGVTWTVLGNQTALSDLTVPIGERPITLFDQWDGYPAARRRLLEGAERAGVANLVALTGDLHSSIAAELTVDGHRYGSEVVVTSISSAFATGGALFELGLSLLEHVKLVDTDHRGYLRARFAPAEAELTFRHVVDPVDPASAIVDGPTFRLTAGSPGLRES